MKQKHPWIDINEQNPPYDELVETKGAVDDGSIVLDYFRSSVGDWIYNCGDPTHWRKIKLDK